ncbi:MFS transporter [Kitasatospora sp. NPDC058218]|uniref:MFS transporter n=1 Tax=Kitasatospora sp. NPDC058218 TaxID=3346385 RepID=UPI0036DB330F
MTAGRVRVLAAFLSFGAFWGAWGVLVPELQHQAHVDDGELGVAVLMIGVGALCSMRIAGTVVDRLGRPATTWCVAVMAAAGFLPSLATSGASLIGLLALTGAASGAMDVAVNALAVDEEARTGSIMNAAHACFSTAVVISAMTTGVVLGSGVGPHGVLAGVSVIILAAAITVHVLDRDATVTARQSQGPGPRAAAWNRPLLLLGGLCALAYLVENAWQSWAAVLLRSAFGTSAEVSALGPAMFAASAAVGRAWGHRMLAGKPERDVLMGGALVGATGTLLAALAPSAALTLAGVVIAGLGTSVCAPTILSLAGASTDRRSRASAISVVTTLGYSGFLVGPAAVGLAATATSLRTSLVGVGVVAVILAACAALIRTGTFDRPQPDPTMPACATPEEDGDTSALNGTHPPS